MDQKKQLLGLLKDALGTTAKGGEQQTALQEWVGKYGQPLLQAGAALFKGGFSYSRLGKFAEVAATAADKLGDIFEGLEQAEVAQALLGIVVRIVTPDTIEPWIMPLIEGEGAKALIEAAFQRVLGPKAVEGPPVIDTEAEDIPEGGLEK